jgi:hypothetical protein
MARYDKNKLFEDSKKLIVEKNLLFIEDIVAYLPCAKQTFYEYFKIDSNELDELKELLEKNRIDIKSSLRRKWHETENATLQMALYKLCSTNTEHRILNTNYNSVDAEIKTTNVLNIDPLE